MKHSGYTPGPWRWMQRGEDYVLEQNGTVLGSILRITSGLEPMIHDQALIADAPRLAARVERLEDTLRGALRIIETAPSLRLDALAAYANTIRAALAEKG